MNGLENYIYIGAAILTIALVADSLWNIFYRFWGHFCESKLSHILLTITTLIISFVIILLLFLWAIY